MKHACLYGAILALLLASTGAHAACYADYKAKRDNPLRLHYGVVQLTGQCTKSAASAELPQRIESEGWTLLNVISVFDESGLQEREASAGQFYLRY